MSTEQKPSATYLNYITSHQLHLRAFIYSSIGNRSDVEDILQKTNEVMLRKAREFPNEREFLAWATTVARYEVLGHIRDRRRDRLVFSPELVEAMTGIADASLDQISDRQEALRKCLLELPESKLQVLQYRYGTGLTIEQISQRIGRTVDAIKSMLLRMRRLLKKCITARLELDNQI